MKHHTGWVGGKEEDTKDFTRSFEMKTQCNTDGMQTGGEEKCPNKGVPKRGRVKSASNSAEAPTEASFYSPRFFLSITSPKLLKGLAHVIFFCVWE